MTSRLLLIFLEILNFGKICNPSYSALSHIDLLLGRSADKPWKCCPGRPGWTKFVTTIVRALMCVEMLSDQVIHAATQRSSPTMR